MHRSIFSIAAITLALAACAGSPHSPGDFRKAVAVGDPDGSLTTIVGPAMPIVRFTSTVRFPDGETESAMRSVLMYDRPGEGPGTCLFQIGHAAKYSSSVVKEDVSAQPCDGRRWAHFRIAGTDIAFIAHLMHTNYKGTPVTLLEIDEHQAPASLRVAY